MNAQIDALRYAIPPTRPTIIRGHFAVGLRHPANGNGNEVKPTWFSTERRRDFKAAARSAGKGSLFELAGLNVLDTSTVSGATALLRELLRASAFSFQDRMRVEAALIEAERGDPRVDHAFAAGLPIANAGNHLGFDAVLVWGDQDRDVASDIFVWRRERIRPLTDEESEEFLRPRSAASARRSPEDERRVEDAFDSVTI